MRRALIGDPASCKSGTSAQRHRDTCTCTLRLSRLPLAVRQEVAALQARVASAESAAAAADARAKAKGEAATAAEVAASEVQARLGEVEGRLHAAEVERDGAIEARADAAAEAHAHRQRRRRHRSRRTTPPRLTGPNSETKLPVSRISSVRRGRPPGTGPSKRQAETRRHSPRTQSQSPLLRWHTCAKFRHPSARQLGAQVGAQSLPGQPEGAA